MDLDYEKIKKFWDSRAHDVDLGMGAVNLGTTQEQSAIQLDCLKQSLKISDRLILELGCGLGRVTIAMAGKSRKIVSVDYSHNMLVAMRRHLDNTVSENVMTVCANCSAKLPFKTAVFDAAVVFGVLLHINDEDLVGMIREIKRVTKPKGKIILRESVGIDGRFEVNKYSEELKMPYSAIYRPAVNIEKEFAREKMKVVVSKKLYQQRKETETWYWVFQK